MASPNPPNPPVLILGGWENSLSVARNLARKHIPVRLSADASCPALRSRFCKARYVIPSNEPADSYWGHLLLGSDSAELRGSVLLACGDNAVEFVAKNRAQLAPMYILDDSVPAVQLAMLDKQRTLELAHAAGCGIPQYWKLDTLADLEPIHRAVTFPVMIKPIDTFLSRRLLGKNFFIVHSSQELDEWASRLLSRGLRIMICEIIPGPDREVQSSYYTYIDGQGRQLFRFTKRVLRRDPPFGGQACLHQTQWLPETAEVGERFLRGIGFRGFGNVEFKRDPRDGQLKVIECNPRFTAAHELLERCGLNAAFLIYCQLTGRPLPMANSYRENVFLWYPVQDLKAQIKGRNGLSTKQWLSSALHWNTAFPYFELDDPWPSAALALDNIRHEIRKKRLS